MSENNHWLASIDKPEAGDEQLILFEVVHPTEPSNGTDGTPQVRVHTFLNGQVDEYDKWLSINDARKMWSNSRGMGYTHVNCYWDEADGVTVLGEV